MSVLLYGAHGEPLLTKPDPDALIEAPEGFDPSEPQPGAKCVTCGCSDEDACLDGCFWVGPAACSACYPELAEYWAMALQR